MTSTAPAKKDMERTLLMQWISYFMIFTVLLIFILEYPSEHGLNWRFYGAVLELGVLLLINILWFRSHIRRRDQDSREYPDLYHWIFIIASNGLALGAFALTGSSEIIFLLFMQTAQFASVVGVWPGGSIYCLVTLGIALGIIKAFGVPNAELIQIAAQFLAGMVFVLVFTLLESRSAQATQRAEGLLKDLQAAHAELKAAQQRETELAIAEERVRLARDIHDGLGHHLTVLSIQLQAAGKLVARNPQAAAEAIQLSRAEAQAALEEVRRSVGVMRESPAESRPLEEMLMGLAGDFQQRTGLETRFEVRGAPVELSSFARQTLFRAVQESLTNVQKHGREVERIQVKLEYASDAIRLAVADDGRAPQFTPAGPAGYGLQGLRERVDQLGGELCCGPGAAGGFMVDVSIPLREVRDDPRAAG